MPAAAMILRARTRTVIQKKPHLFNILELLLFIIFITIPFASLRGIKSHEKKGTVPFNLNF
jgi:hypothetical protein